MSLLLIRQVHIIAQPDAESNQNIEVVMSNTIAVQTMNPVIDESISSGEANTAITSVQPSPAKIIAPDPSEPPTLEMLMQMYATQERECWLCDGIAKKVAGAKEISEDDRWHFTSCVLSWEYLHRNNE